MLFATYLIHYIHINVKIYQSIETRTLQQNIYQNLTELIYQQKKKLPTSY